VAVTTFSADLTVGAFSVPKNKQAEFHAMPRPVSVDETGADILIDGVIAARVPRLATAPVGPLFASAGAVITIDGNTPVSINGRLTDV
jgi:hypothetical protein